MKDEELDGDLVLLRENLRIKAYEISHSVNTKIPNTDEPHPLLLKFFQDFADSDRGKELIDQTHAYIADLVTRAKLLKKRKTRK